MDSAIAAFEHEWTRGDRAVARDLAREYVAAHRAALEPILSQYTREGCVSLIDGYRRDGRDEDRLIVEAWLLSEYDPQQIEGTMSLNAAQAISDAFHRDQGPAGGE